MKLKLKRHVLYLLTSCMALLFSLPLVAQQTQKTRDETHSLWRWEHSDDGLKRRFEARGKPEFTDDYSDIKSVSEGGWVIIEEQRNGQSLRYEVRHDPAGKLTRAFYVNGAARPLDESTALAKTRNQSEEVLRLLLEAATEISSDYEKATLLIEVSNVYTGDTRLRSEFLKAVESIKSDYERGRVLSTLLKNKQIG